MAEFKVGDVVRLRADHRLLGVVREVRAPSADGKTIELSMDGHWGQYARDVELVYRPSDEAMAAFDVPGRQDWVARTLKEGGLVFAGSTLGGGGLDTCFRHNEGEEVFSDDWRRAMVKGHAHPESASRYLERQEAEKRAADDPLVPFTWAAMSHDASLVATGESAIGRHDGDSVWLDVPSETKYVNVVMHKADGLVPFVAELMLGKAKIAVGRVAPKPSVTTITSRDEAVGAFGEGGVGTSERLWESAANFAPAETRAEQLAREMTAAGGITFDQAMMFATARAEREEREREAAEMVEAKRADDPYRRHREAEAKMYLSPKQCTDQQVMCIGKNNDDQRATFGRLYRGHWDFTADTLPAERPSEAHVWSNDDWEPGHS